MRMNSPDQQRAKEAIFERILVDAFRKAGWKVERQPAIGGWRPDLLVRRGSLAYAVELKHAPEGRRDRLIPLMANAILQAQASVRSSPELAPLAVVASARIPEAFAEELRRFVSDYAPGVAAGVLDLEGFRAFVGGGLEALNASPQGRSWQHLPRGLSQHHLFSDLNQWLLKVLLAPRLPENLLGAPRGNYRNASELARAARVSVMSASRLARQLRAEGFLDEAGPAWRLVRTDELLSRWRVAQLRTAREWPMRWILREDDGKHYERIFRVFHPEERGSKGKRRDSRPRPLARACLGLFAAADALGIGVVHGVKPHILVADFRLEIARQLGLMRADPGQPPDVYVRIPLAPESVFRSVVRQNDVLVCDVLQVWLDVAGHPARGGAQALEIERRVLRPLLEER